MLVPVTTWNAALAEYLAALPLGVVLQITGHVSARRWQLAEGVERLGAEVQIDHVAVDVGDVWRQTDSAWTHLISGKGT
jgi:hypothetical protein